jgi:uncharacterized membrane protein HdeD (DUF308 family)
MSSDASFPPPSGAAPAAARPGEIPAPASTVVTVLHDLWWIRLILGLVAVVVGVMVIAWPEATVTVVAVLFGINLLIDGVLRVLQAILTPSPSATVRILYALLGAVSIVIGVLCLRNLLQTVAVLVVLVGISWLLAGVFEIIVVFSSGPPSRWNAQTALNLATGVVALLAGTVVLAYPEVSLTTLVILLGVCLLVSGSVSVLEAFRLRAQPVPRSE